jgi:hypothetical protein
VKKRPAIMKRPAIIITGAILIAAAVMVSAFQGKSRRERAAALKVGDTKQQVERLLGTATMTTPFTPMWRTNAVSALFSDTTETWGYGNRFDFKSRFPWLQFRLFLPSVNDITVEFNASGKVVRVTVPPEGS